MEAKVRRGERRFIRDTSFGFVRVAFPCLVRFTGPVVSRLAGICHAPPRASLIARLEGRASSAVQAKAHTAKRAIDRIVPLVELRLFRVSDLSVARYVDGV